MHTYIMRTRDDGTLEWVVMFADTGGARSIKSFSSEEDAAAYVSYLNGGAVMPPVSSQAATLVP